ncbi:MAG TPA: hypothetical protein V6C97_21610, partial [Oculatellaceae cyanobacterium]
MTTIDHLDEQILAQLLDDGRKSLVEIGKTCNTETMVADTIQDTTSNQAFSYTPNATGTYKVDFYFPETY